MAEWHRLTAIVPCNDLDASEAFYRRLGFTRSAGEADDGYRILADGRGGHLHLTATPPGWVVPARNPFGVYLYSDAVDELAAGFHQEIIGGSRAEDKPWGMYEFALSDPNGTLVRVGRPSRSPDAAAR